MEPLALVATVTHNKNSLLLSTIHQSRQTVRPSDHNCVGGTHRQFTIKHAAPRRTAPHTNLPSIHRTSCLPPCTSFADPDVLDLVPRSVVPRAARVSGSGTAQAGPSELLPTPSRRTASLFNCDLPSGRGEEGERRQHARPRPTATDHDRARVMYSMFTVYTGTVYTVGGVQLRMHYWRLLTRALQDPGTYWRWRWRW